MPTTYSLRLRYALPATGELSGTWGSTVNASITNLLDETIDAVSSIAMANVNQTLTIPDGTSSPNRARTLNATGAHTAIRTLTVPSGNGTFRVINSTTGGFNVAVKTPSSGSIQIEPGFEGYFISQGASLTLSNPRFASLLATTATIASLSASFSDGTEAVSSVNFTSDLDTGMYRIGANSIGFSTGAVQCFSLTSALASFSSNVTVSRTGAAVSLTSAAASNRSIRGQTGGVDRWAAFLGNATAESGSSAGSNFTILRYDDAGASLGTAMIIDRATGDVAINNTITASGVRLNVVHLAGEALLNPTTIRATNINNSSGASSEIAFAVGASATLRARVRAEREAATVNGRLVLSSALAGAAVDVLTLNSDGSADFVGDCAAVTFTTISDLRKKESVQPFDLGLDAILSLSPSTFVFKADPQKRRHVGLIAQDVQKTDLGEHAVHIGPDGTLSLEPNVVIYALVNAVKELQAEIRRMKGYP